MSNHYVDNEKFAQTIIEYQKRKENNPDEPIPDYIGICIMDIATRFARRPNFSGYTYKDDMIADAIENCVKAIPSFDAEKSKNPFSYFTQTCFYAFLRRIMVQKKQSYVKYKLVENCDTQIEPYHLQEDDNSEFLKEHINDIKKNNAFDGKAFEDFINKRKQNKKKKEKSKTPVELLFE